MDRALRAATLVVPLVIAVLLAFILSTLLGLTQTMFHTYDGRPVNGIRVAQPYR